MQGHLLTKAHLGCGNTHPSHPVVARYGQVRSQHTSRPKLAPTQVRWSEAAFQLTPGPSVHWGYIYCYILCGFGVFFCIFVPFDGDLPVESGPTQGAALLWAGVAELEKAALSLTEQTRLGCASLRPAGRAAGRDPASVSEPRRKPCLHSRPRWEGPRFTRVREEPSRTEAQ